MNHNKEMAALINKWLALFGDGRSRIEYHARRTDEDPKLWKVVEVRNEGYAMEIVQRELATGLKRNRAQALVKLLRGNQRHDRA